MKNKKIWIVVTVLLTICISVLWAVTSNNVIKEFPTSSQRASKPLVGKDTLEGLQGVPVIVYPFAPEVEKYGLSTQQLHTDVELRLRQNGIKVLSLTPEHTHLYLQITAKIRTDTPVVAYTILLDLMEVVFLERDITKRCWAQVWSTRGVGSVGIGKIESIREKVKDCVDEFSNDYLAVNPTLPASPLK